MYLTFFIGDLNIFVCNRRINRNTSTITKLKGKLFPVNCEHPYSTDSSSVLMTPPHHRIDSKEISFSRKLFSLRNYYIIV